MEIYIREGDDKDGLAKKCRKYGVGCNITDIKDSEYKDDVDIALKAGLTPTPLVCITTAEGHKKCGIGHKAMKFLAAVEADKKEEVQDDGGEQRDTDDAEEGA